MFSCGSGAVASECSGVIPSCMQSALVIKDVLSRPGTRNRDKTVQKAVVIRGNVVYSTNVRSLNCLATCGTYIRTDTRSKKAL
jgi:hypothetical protein